MNKVSISFGVTFTLLFLPMLALSQFSWVSGENTSNINGTYGTQGVFDAANVPGSRWGATTWKDATGYCWMFGGEGYASTSGVGRLNDLWKYDPGTNQWMWVKGSDLRNRGGVYGTRGVADTANNPGSREVAVNWMDMSGDLWIFGGYGYDINGSIGFLNDLWKYDVSANMWTWMSGDTIRNARGVYGTQGVPGAANNPGGRYHGVGMVKTSGNLILFSGSGYGESGFFPSNLNDLWEYDMSLNQWTWLSGDKTIGQSGIYGTKGTGAAGIKPGGRVHAVSWSDNNGNFWIFSGYGKASLSGNGYLNDLFKYDFTTGYWAWMSGDTVTNQSAVYSDSCAATANNKPGARQAAVSWLDDVAGIFYVFGGQGLNAGSTVGQLNDIWAYDRVTDQWSWIRGTGINENGAYGTKSVGDMANMPGGRNHPSGWRINNTLWLFGGAGYPASGSSGILNDLWKLPFYSICGNAPLPIALLDFSASKSGSNDVKVHWETASEVNNASFTVERSANGIMFEKITTVPGSGNSTSRTAYEIIDREPLPGISYYRLASTSFDGHYVIESRMVSVNMGLASADHPQTMRVIPNPVNAVTGELYFTLPKSLETALDMQIISMTGQRVLEVHFDGVQQGRSSGILRLPDGMTAGIYNLVCRSNGKVFSARLAVHR